VSRSPLQIQLYLKIGIESTSNKRIVHNWQSILLTTHWKSQTPTRCQNQCPWFRSCLQSEYISGDTMKASYSNTSQQWVSSDLDTLQGPTSISRFSLTRPQRNVTEISEFPSARLPEGNNSRTAKGTFKEVDTGQLEQSDFRLRRTNTKCTLHNGRQTFLQTRKAVRP